MKRLALFLLYVMATPLVAQVEADAPVAVVEALFANRSYRVHTEASPWSTCAWVSWMRSSSSRWDCRTPSSHLATSTVCAEGAPS
ncbi:MAG: hypothetical protein P8170_04365 [Gemmatimonadota bacterium]